MSEVSLERSVPEEGDSVQLIGGVSIGEDSVDVPPRVALTPTARALLGEQQNILHRFRAVGFGTDHMGSKFEAAVT